ncbi:hypothetical protein [Amycolatopsis bartoniae]|uniref:hypothetical protein n=1 Tax=Amycolatopsis bartoniae TaxID=941986 RepID=UPI0011AB6FD0|nr:hypothetical protein [Amycolatopsis bartoniae]
MTILILVYLESAALFCCWRSYRLWRSREYFERVIKQMLVIPFGNDVCRGLLRGWLPFTLGVTALAVSVPMLLFGTARMNGPILLAAISLVGVTAVGVFLQLTVTWFSRPKWCIPPYLRQEQGVWAERRGSKDIRHG